ncbi:MAG TPA: CBS domain-containing protein [Sedimentisphaerales bacterium]|nr:CBS domain-containing protein [Sedimentisphaerales bacterium]
MAKAREVMSHHVISVRDDEDIYAAIRVMATNEVTGLPVVDKHETLVGIITEKDVLVLLYTMQDRPGMVRDFMTRDVVCFDQESDVAEVAEALRTRNFRRAPILDRGRLVGIISRRDIIRHMRELRNEDRLLRDSILELVF